MASLIADALIDESEFADYKQWDSANVNLPADAVISFINWASLEMKQYCGGRIFIKPAAQVQEIFDGDGTKDYYTKHGNIGDTTPLTGVKIYRWESPNWDEKLDASWSRVFDAENGRIWFDNGDRFNVGEDNWRIDYFPGWVVTDVPADLKGICKQVVYRLLKLAEGKEGLTTESFGDAAHTYNLEQLLSGDIRLRLRQYRRRFL